MSRFVAFDVETPNRLCDRMSAIGITVIEEDRITEEFYSLVDPETHFDEFNVQLTGISEETVAGAPTFREVWGRIGELMSSGLIVAHNAVFDLGVLGKCLRAYGIVWKPYVRYLCTVQMGRRLFPGMRHSLDVDCARFGIPLDHHIASSDSRACAELLMRYMKDGAEVREHIRTWSFDRRDKK